MERPGSRTFATPSAQPSGVLDDLDESGPGCWCSYCCLEDGAKQLVRSASSGSLSAPLTRRGLQRRRSTSRSFSSARKSRGGICCAPLWCCGDGSNSPWRGSNYSGSSGHATPNSPGRLSFSSSPRQLRAFEERLYASLDRLEVQRKVAVLGFRGVGKSALIARFVYDRFVDTYEPTIEYTFRTTVRRNNVRFVFDILDTSAQDEYSTLSRQASVGVHGYILMYSTVSKTSFENVKHIHGKLIDVIGGANIPIVLVASKCDLDGIREVHDNEGIALAKSWGCPFIACSARDNWQVEKVFSELLGEIERDSGLLTTEEEEETACRIL